MTSMEKAINLGYLFLTFKPQKNYQYMTTFLCMYWYVSIYLEKCFLPQYMYPKLNPNNGYRWFPLGKLSHLWLEQLISQDAPPPANSICRSGTPPASKRRNGGTTGTCKQPWRPSASAGRIDQGDGTRMRIQFSSEILEWSPASFDECAAVPDGVFGPRRTIA